MSVIAQYLINDITKEERFVVGLPSDYVFQAGERLVSREISEEDYSKFSDGNESHIKIFRYSPTVFADERIPPFGLDYKVGLNRRLYHDFTFVAGRLVEARYYSECSRNANGSFTFNDLILVVNFHYTIHPATKFVYERTKEITWYREDNTPHPLKKQMHKFYSGEESDSEVIKARGNIISYIKIEIATFLAAMFAVQYPDPSTRPDSNAAAKMLMAKLATPIVNYINGGDPSLKTIIANEREPVMNAVMTNGKTVRAFILGELI